ncbi:MAG: hypothetical protein ACW98X_16975 [Promethearchaeota archaeon]|jgi:ABC-type proline/glycine betaine transport system permease subunit
MEKHYSTRQRKFELAFIIKRILDAVLISSVTVIIISLFMFFWWPSYNSYLSRGPRLLHVGALDYIKNIDNYMRMVFLPAMLTPSAICIAIFTPMRILMSKQLKTPTLEHSNKAYKNQTNLFHLKKARDFHDLYYPYLNN